MSEADSIIPKLLAEKEELQARLEEVEETLNAIRTGEVDALVVDGKEGPQVFILQAADADSNRFRSDILSKINDAVVATDEHDRILFANAAAEASYGVSVNEVMGLPLDNFYHHQWAKPEDKDEATRSLAEHGQWRGENIHIKQDGTRIRVESSVSTLLSGDGSEAGLLSVIRDITARHDFEVALRRSEERYRTLFDSIDEGFCIIEMIPNDEGELDDFRFLDVSPSFEKQSGMSGAEGKSIRELAPDTSDDEIAIYREVAKSGCAMRREYFSTRLDRWLDIHATPFGPSEERQVAILFKDIQDRKNVEDSLKRNEALFHDIIDQAPGGVYVIDDRMRTFQVNRAALPVFSQVRPFLDRPFIEVMEILWGPELGADLVDRFRRTLETGEPYDSGDFTHDRADIHERKSYDWSIRRIFLPSGNYGVVCYFSDTTELEQAAERLRASEQAAAAQAEALKRADRSKDEFLAMLAHELRNPLAPLRNAVAILQSEESSPAQRDRAQLLMGRQIDNMSRMIDDLLDVSRITEGKIELRKKPVVVQSVLQAAVESARPASQQNGQELHMSLPETPVVVDGDSTRLEQVVGNLLTNACKYSGDGSRIELFLEVTQGPEDDAQALIRVADNGHGIDSELLPSIFELFVQSSRSLDRAHGGLGIGLTIVHRLVLLHGGKIEAHSAGSGRGAEFRIWLPLSESPDAGQTERVRGAPRKGKLRLLIVDDNRDAADSMAMLQGMHGHEVRTAYDGPGALEAAKEFLPEVVLLDIGLPGMDGYDVARGLRTSPATRNAFLVAMTGYGTDEDERKALAAGFDRHLVKPADLTVLSGWLEERLESP